MRMRTIYGALCLLTAFAFGSLEARAQTCAFANNCTNANSYYWCGGAEGNWNVASNWCAPNCSTARPNFPGGGASGDSACAIIGSCSGSQNALVHFTVGGGTERINKVRIHDGSTLSFDTAGNILQVMSDATLEGEVVVCQGATFSMTAGNRIADGNWDTGMDAVGSFTADGTLNHTSGLIRFNGATSESSATFQNVDIGHDGTSGSWSIVSGTAQTVKNAFTMGLSSCNDSLTINGNSRLKVNDWVICSTASINAMNSGATVELTGVTTFPDNASATATNRRFAKLHISGGTTTLNADIRVDEELRIDDGATLDLGGRTVQLYGNLVINGTGAINPGTGGFQFLKNGVQTISGTGATGIKDLGTTTIGSYSIVENSLPSIDFTRVFTINTDGTFRAGSGTVYFSSSSSNFIINGTFDAQTSTVVWGNTNRVPNATFYNLVINANCRTQNSGILYVSNDLSINASRTFRADADIVLGGNWARYGTFTHNNNTVTCNNNCTILTSETFGNLATSGAGTVLSVSTNSVLTVAQTFTLAADTAFNAGNGTNIILSNNPVISGTVNADTSTIELRGNTLPQITYYNLTIGGNIAASAGTTIISNDLRINNTRTLSCGNGVTLELAGNFIRAGTFNGSGTCTMRFYGAKDTWFYNSAAFPNLQIDKASPDYKVFFRANLTSGSSFTFTKGYLEINSYTLTLSGGGTIGDGAGNSDAVIELAGTGAIVVGSGRTLNFQSDSYFKSSGSGPNITRSGTGTYTLLFSGKVNISRLSVAYADANGLQLTIGDSSNIEAFNYLAFANIGGGSGTALRINNTTGSPLEYTWANHSFAVTMANNLNVAVSANPILITMQNASGTRSGEAYDIEDAANGKEVIWQANVNWVGGYSGAQTDWHAPQNWSSGIVPDMDTSVTIPNVTYKPVISNGDASVRGITINANSSLTVNSGRTLNIHGIFVRNGSYLADPASTTVFAGDELQQIPIAPYGNLNVSNPAGATFAGNMTIYGTVTIEEGSSLHGGSHTITVNGSWNDVSGFGFTAGTSRITMASTAPADISQSNFYNLNIDDGTKTLQGDIVVDYDLTITNDGTFNPSSRTFTVRRNFYNQWTTLGGMSPGTHTLFMDCPSGYTANISVSASSANFNNIKIASTCTTQIGGTKTVNLTGTMTIENGGTLNGTDDTFNIQKNWTLLGGSSNFTHTGSTVRFTGLGSQEVTLARFNNLVVDKPSGTLTAAGELTVSGTLNIMNGTFHLGSGHTHTVTGAISLSASSGENALLNTGGSVLVSLNNFTSGAGGQLAMSGDTSLQIGNNRSLQLSGNFTSQPADGKTPVITRQGATGSFQMLLQGGVVNVTGLVFEYGNATGMSVTSGVSSIAAFNNISYRYNQGNNNSNSHCLRFNKPGNFQLDGINFDSSCAGSKKNISTTMASPNSIVMTNYSGAGGGAAYESDPNNIITWANNNLWSGGSSARWSLGGNWSRGAAPATSDIVTIDTVTNQPSEVDVSSTFSSLEIRSGSVLTIGYAADTDLISTGNCDIKAGGSLVMQTNDTSDLACSGDFINSGAVNQNAGTGYIRLRGSGRSAKFEGESQTVRRVEVASGASYTLTSDLTFDTSATNNFDVAGSLNADNYTITTNSLNVGGTFNAQTGKVVWRGGTLPTNITYFDLEIDSNTASIAGTLTVTGNLTIKNGRSFTTNNNAVNITGNLVVENGALLAAGGSAISVGGSVSVLGTGSVTGTSTLTFASASSDTFTVAGNYSGTKVINSSGNALALNGSVTIAAEFENRGSLNIGANSLTLSGVSGHFDNNGGTVSLTSNSALVSSVNFTNRASSTVDFGTSTAGLVVSGNYSDAGTVNIGSSTVTFTGTGGTIATPNSLDFYNVVFSGSKTASNALDVEGAFTIQSGGSFTAGAYNHKIAGNWLNEGTFTSTGSTITFDGSGAQSISASTFNNLAVNKASGALTAQGNLTVQGALTVAAGTFNLGSSRAHTANSGSISGVLNMGSGSTSLTMSGGLTVNSGGQLQMSNAPLTLSMANGTALTINSGGSIQSSGSGANTPAITTSGGTHAFDIYGTANITGLIHTNPDANGIYLRAGATITAFDNISHNNNSNTFVRVGAMAYTGTWNGHTFNGASGYNVSTDSGGSGTITMTSFSGSRAGEDYDNDLGVAVNWQEGIVWEGDVSNNWNNGDNWSSGVVPGAGDTATIPASAPNMPTMTANSAIGSLTIAENATLNLGGQTLSIGGSLANSGTITHSSGKILLNGSGAQTLDVGASPLYDLEVNKSGGTASVTGNLTLARNLVMTAGSFELGSGTHSVSGAAMINGGTLFVSTSKTTVTGALTVAGASSVLNISQTGAEFTAGSLINQTSGTISFGGGSATLKVKGNFNNSATFSIGLGTVILEGSSSTITTASGDGDFYNLTVTGSYTANDSLDINNNLVVSGSLNLGGASLAHDVANNITVQSGGTMNLQNSQLTISGTNKSLTVNSGGTLTMATSSKLRLASGGAVSISGTFSSTYSGTRPAISNNGSGTISFVVNSGGAININGLSFANADANGMRILSGANVVDLDNIAFTNVVSGGTHLKLLVTSGAFDFSGCSFDSSFGLGSGYNIETAGTATVTMTNWSGAGGGEHYDNPKDSSVITWSNQVTWVGYTSTNWMTASNWSTNSLPDSASDVIIPQVNPGYNNPTLSATTTIGSLRIQNGGNLTLSTGSSLTVNSNIALLTGGTFNMSAGSLYARGDFTSSGTMNFTGGNSYASGTGNQTLTALTLFHMTVSNTGGRVLFDPTVSVRNLTLNSGTSSAVGVNDTLRVNGNSTINGLLELSEGSRLQLYSLGTHQVSSTGTLKSSSTNSSWADVENTGSGYYTMNIGGATDLSYVRFNNVGAGGITLTSSSYPTGSGLNYVTFKGGQPTSALSYLNIYSGSGFGGYTFNGLAFEDTSATGETSVTNSSSPITMVSYAQGEGWLSGAETSQGDVNWGPNIVEMGYVVAFGNHSTGRVEVVWRTLSEYNNIGFIVHKSGTPNGGYAPVSSILPGMGTTPFGMTYTFIDSSAPNEELYYIIEDIDYSGATSYHGPVRLVWGGEAPKDLETLAEAGSYGSAGDTAYAYEGVDYERGSASSPLDAAPMFINLTEERDALFSLNNGLEVRSERGNLFVTLYTPEAEFKKAPQACEECVSLSLKGLSHISRFEIGAPELPMVSFYIKTKAGAKPNMKYRAIEGKPFAILTLRPSPKTILSPERADSGSVDSTAITQLYIMDKAAYAAEKDPETPARITPVGAYSDFEIHRLDLFPVSYMPKLKEAVKYAQISVDLSFDKPERKTETMSAPALCEPSPTEQALAYFTFAQSGVKRITFESLVQAGIDSAKVELRRGNNEPVAYFVEGDSILFYAEVREYEETAAYFLFANEAPALFVETLPMPQAEKEAALLEKRSFVGDYSYVAKLGGKENKDRFIFAGSAVNGIYKQNGKWEFQIENPRREGTAKLSANFLKGADGEPRRLFLNLNGYDIGVFDIQSEASLVEIEIPAAYLLAGINTLNVGVEDPRRLAERLGYETKLTYSAVWLAVIEVEYPVNAKIYSDKPNRLLLANVADEGASAFIAHRSPEKAVVCEITDPARPKRLETAYSGSEARFPLPFGASRIMATSFEEIELASLKIPIAENLRCKDKGSEYIAIAPAAWQAELNGLIELRKEQGLTARFVAAEAIAEQFGEGILSAEAISAFIAYITQNYSQKPRYITLVGSANLDGKSRLSVTDLSSHPNIMPTHKPFTGEFGETIGDYLYASPNAETPPLFAIGRIPARNKEQLTNYLQKLYAYELTEIEHLWERKTLFISDKDYEFEVCNDEAMSFVDYNYLAGRIDGKEYSTAGFREAIIEELNRGSLLTNYIGHASGDTWSRSRAFKADSIYALQNKDMPTVLLSIACLNGFFNYPQGESMAEAFLNAEGGAVAVVASGGIHGSAVKQAFHNGMMNAFFANDERKIGDIMRLGMLAHLAANGGNDEGDVNKTYALFGDSALSLRSPVPKTPAGLIAKFNGSAAELRWSKNRETDVIGYNIYRYSVASNGALSAPRLLTERALVKDNFYVDSSFAIEEEPRRFVYRIQAIDFEGLYSKLSEGVYVTVTSTPAEEDAGYDAGAPDAAEEDIIVTEDGGVYEDASDYDVQPEADADYDTGYDPDADYEDVNTEPDAEEDAGYEPDADYADADEQDGELIEEDAGETDGGYIDHTEGDAGTGGDSDAGYGQYDASEEERDDEGEGKEKDGERSGEGEGEEDKDKETDEDNGTDQEGDASGCSCSVRGESGNSPTLMLLFLGVIGIFIARKRVGKE